MTVQGVRDRWLYRRVRTATGRAGTVQQVRVWESRGIASCRVAFDSGEDRWVPASWLTLADEQVPA